ncbi:MAG: hypothetical protein QXV31_03405 [Zestosphaera sp.]
MRPEAGLRSPAKHLARVVLPEPLFPKTPTNSHSLISRLTESKALVPSGYS